VGSKLAVFSHKFQRIFKLHQVFVVTLALLILLIAVVMRVSTLSNLGPDQNYLNQQASKVQVVNFKEDAIKEIESLRDSNVTVPATQLPSGRQNPFSE
jgi:hypothetical protein